MSASSSRLLVRLDSLYNLEQDYVSIKERRRLFPFAFMGPPVAAAAAAAEVNESDSSSSRRCCLGASHLADCTFNDLLPSARLVKSKAHRKKERKKPTCV